MPNLTSDNAYRGYSPELMYAFLSNYQLPRDIGSKFEYSNYGMGLLGQLLAQKSGTTYESLVRQRICERLGMSDTLITLTAATQKRLAPGHRGDSQVSNWDLAALAGAGALRSTTNDMLTFLAANMGLQKTPLCAAMDLAQTPRRPTDADGMQVGLAWLILTGAKRPICWHNGGTGGYRSFIGFDKAAKLGIVVLSNSSQDVDDIGFHFLLPAIPLSDYSAAAARMPRPVAVALLPGEKLPTGEALFERAIQQIGGRAAMANTQNRRTQLEMEMAGIKGSVIAYQTRSGQAYGKVDLLGLLSVEEGTDGTIAWEVNSLEGPRILTEREKETLRVIDPFDLAIGKELYRSFTCDGKYQIQGQACYKVVATSKNYAIPVTWYFAADSGLPVGKEYTIEKGNAKMPIQERSGDYRRVEKVLYPFDVQQLVQGVILRSRVKRIEHNVSIPAGQFDPPEAVKKIRAQGTHHGG
jgi:CubicO group peptidase (beta-lactamase class C family)